MGTWDSGNFENDTAVDLVAELSESVSQEIRPPECVEDDELIMAAVAVLKVLVQHCHAAPPERAKIESVRDAVLTVYDAEIDGLDPSPEYKAERRQVIEQTFAQFLALIDEQ